jgi:hypothetical protein
MFTGVALITFGGVGWLTGQLYNYGTIEKLKSAQELNEDSPNGVFGYVSHAHSCLLLTTNNLGSWSDPIIYAIEVERDRR